MCTLVTPAVPYLLLGLQDVQWAVGNSRGARKLARTPHGLCDLSFTSIYAAKDIKDFCLNQCPKIFPQPSCSLFPYVTKVIKALSEKIRGKYLHGLVKEKLGHS
uniref:Uncharacterized protein n=1 Tax=Populus trichocarpa TaxID=3694 RepID=A0A2K1XPU6_POPTR